MSKQASIQYFRQGDIVFVVEGDLDLSAGEAMPTPGGKAVVALGEVTGHSHVAEAVKRDVPIQWISMDGNRYLQSESEIVVKHQEHAPITLPAGVAILVIQQVEFDVSGALRQVVD